jgi:hypothetical protein
MTNREKKIVSLLEEGFSYDTIKKMSDTHINMLYNRLVKEEETSTVQKTTYSKQDIQSMKNKSGGLKVNNGTVTPNDDGSVTVTQEMGESDKDLDNSVEKESGYDPYAGNSVGNDDGPSDNMNANDGMSIDEEFFGDINEDEVLEALFGKPKMKTPITTLGMFEGEVDEKFESKSQQRLFYAKCEEEGPKSKWCKMAKEFSDDTKDFKSLPEKVSEEEKIRQIEESIVSLIKKTQGKVLTKKDILSEEPKIAPARPTVKPGVKPERGTPYQPKHSPKPKAGTEVKPARPTVKPGVKPERGTPYQPKHSPKPKAGTEVKPARPTVKPWC